MKTAPAAAAIYFAIASCTAVLAVERPSAGVRLAGCELTGKPRERSANGRLERVSVWSRIGGAQRARVAERWTQTTSGHHWEIEIASEGAVWSAPIEAFVEYQATRNTLIWTAWDHQPGRNHSEWADPLTPAPLRAWKYTYGGPRYTMERPGIPWWSWEQQPNGEDYFSVPVFTWIEPGRSGTSVVVSPRTMQLDLEMAVEDGGRVGFTWHRHRLAKGAPVRFALDIVNHEDDWRGGLRWMAETYPEYFDPPNGAADLMAGSGAYSNHEGELDVAAMKRMAFSINWRASFDFPYMGMFLPPVPPPAEWMSFRKVPTSQSKLEDYNRRMAAAGFHVLSYFNVTEFGTSVIYPPQPGASSADWRDANRFLWTRLAAAVLHVPVRLPLVNVKWPDGWQQTRPGGLFYTWEKGVAMDCGEPVYRSFLMEQAQRHLDNLPGSSGFCIDRLDWLRLYNLNRDDGVSWFDGAPARSLFWSWQTMMDRLGPLVHRAGKVIFVNPLYKRLDVLRQVDGLFDEMGDHPAALNGDAVVGMRKPLIVWRDRPIPPAEVDTYFQRLLHLGAYPMCPFPGNDHGLEWKSEEVRRPFEEYGPLLALMRGKKWVLAPHAIEVEGSAAAANLFKVTEGYVAPITRGKKDVVTVQIRNIPGISKSTRCQAFYPGQELPQALSGTLTGDVFQVEVPLKRGCALLRLR